MPVGQALDSALLGAVFGLFPIMWIVVNAVWVYNLTVESGHFAVLRRSFATVSDDQRIQAVIIAFCFGALLEALAGFGTPVAICTVMLMAMGFSPIKSAAVALVANTAPVAFGAMATPIVTLAEITGLPKEDLGAMVGRQTPVLALFVPLILVGMVDGMRGVRQTWPAAVVGGVVFAIGQFLCSNYISVELTDIVAALLGTGAIVALLRVWQPSEPLLGERQAKRPAMAGAAGEDHAHEAAVADRNANDTGGDVARAYAPYFIIIVIFSLAQLGPIKDALDGPTQEFAWPGLDVQNPDGEALSSATFKLNWLAAPGTLVLISGLLTMLRPAARAGDRRAGLRQDARPAQVGDPHRRRGARPRVRHEPVRADHHARPVGGRRRRVLRVPERDHRLARRRGDRLGHLLELAVRRPAGRRGQGGGPLARPCSRPRTRAAACWAR